MDVKFSGLEGFDRILDALDSAPEIVARAQYRGINYAANKAQTAVRRRIVSEVNLTQAYVRERMDLVPATQARPVAILRAKKRPTSLARYAALQLTKMARGAKGDPRRGIPAGRKQAGISVKVKAKGARKILRGAFLLPLRAGMESGGNGWGIFVREGTPAARLASIIPGAMLSKHRTAGGLRHLYAPSVDQVFNTVLPSLPPAIRDDLQKETRRLIELDLKRAFSR